MKAYRILYFIIVLFVSGVFTSCSDFLEVESINKVSPDGFISDSRTKENAVVAAYVLTNRAITQQGAWAYHNDIRAGLTFANDDLYSYFVDQELNAINPTMETYRDWNRYYEAIAQCNYVIGELADGTSEFISENERIQAKGEVLFLRAYLHFYLTKVWGDVPIILKEGEEGPVSSSPASDVLTQVVIDLEEALELLSDYIYDERGAVSFSSSKRRATKPAALALLARVALEKGDYVKGVLAFVEFEKIDEVPFMLSPVSSMSNVFKGSSTENIFGLSDATDFYSENYNPYIATTNVGVNEVKLAITDSVIIKQIYESDDPRIERNFDDNNGMLQLQKFDQGYYVVCRYGELLLTAAELYHKGGNDSKALELLNKIRVRAEQTELEDLVGTDLFDAIKAERMRELFAEGHSFFDYMRWDEVAQRVDGITQEQVDAGIAYWPLSRQNIGGFFNVSQNAYWN